MEVAQEAWPRSLWVFVSQLVALAILASRARGAASSAKGRLARALTLPSFGICVATQVSAHQLVRAHALGSASGPTGTLAYYAAVDVRLGILHAGLMLVWAVGCLLVVGGVRMRSPKADALTWDEWLVGSCGWIALVTAVLLLSGSMEELAALPRRSVFLTEQPGAARILQRAGERFEVLRWIAIGSGLVPGLLALALLARSKLTTPSPAQVYSTAGLALLGAAMFHVTRPYAYDARRPLPVLTHHSTFNPCACDPRYFKCDDAGTHDYPQLRTCAADAAWTAGLDLTLHGDGSATLDDAFVGNANDISTSAVTNALASSGARRKPPHPSEPLSEWLVLRASARTRVSALAPALRAAAAAGVNGLLLCSAPLPRDIETRTLGTLKRSEQCALPVRFRSDAAPLEQFNTWQDVANAAEGGVQALSLTHAAR